MGTQLLPIRENPTSPVILQLSPEQRIKLSLELPDLFSRTYLGTELWSMQKKILNSLLEPQVRVAVKACHASGKTFTAAVAVLWFLAKYTEAVVVTTAPTWGQVERVLWGEVHSLLSRSNYPYPEANQTRLYLGPKRQAYGLATSVTKSDEGVKFQGIHAKNVLIVLDEAPGVEQKIWEAVEGARAGGNVRILAIGNPTISSGPFHDAFVNNRSGWKPLTISAFDTPNLYGTYKYEEIGTGKPGDILCASPEDLKKYTHEHLTTRLWVWEKYYEWGIDHPLWGSRVLGNFPKQSSDALLSLSWLEKARDLEQAGKGKLRAGIDVAGPGEDETSLTVRRGGEIIFHKQSNKPDPRGELVMWLNQFRTELEFVNIDRIGIGEGIYLHLNDLGFPMIPINICETSNDSDKYFNLKAEYYWTLREKFKNGEISGLKDEKTIGQLAGIRWKATPRGQIQIESKEDAAKRGVKSPDRAESIMLAFAENNLAFGALEYYKNMEKVEATKNLRKPLLAENSLSCPYCQAVCITRSQGQWRCGQCGKQFSTDGETRIEAKQETRGQILKKFEARKVRFFD